MKIAKWIFYFLIFAGLYNLTWGIFIFLSPHAFWNLLHPQSLTFPFFVYLLGFAVSILGILYILSSKNPIKFYWIIVLGILSKTLGPIADFWFFNTDNLVLENLFWFMFINDIIWVLPFFLVLKTVIKYRKTDNI